jgi:hypothetical protein
MGLPASKKVARSYRCLMAKKSKKAARAVAVVTIHRAGEMTPRGRALVGAWLRHQAAMLELTGKNYATRFRGRYIPVK